MSQNSRNTQPSAAGYSHRTWQAFKDTVFIFASIHLVVLVGYSLFHWQTDHLNIVNILSLPLMTSAFPINTATFVIGCVIAGALGWWSYHRHGQS